MKYSSKRILVCIEDSEASKDVLEYVGDLVSGNDGFAVHAFHAVGPAPPALREFAGAENPNTEEKLDFKLHQRQEQWIRTAKSQAQPLMDQIRMQLNAVGILDKNITTHLIVLEHEEDFIGEILKTASKNRCGTIVVGKSSLPWLKELFTNHTGEELLKQADGFGICVVQ